MAKRLHRLGKFYVFFMRSITNSLRRTTKRRWPRCTQRHRERPRLHRMLPSRQAGLAAPRVGGAAGHCHRCVARRARTRAGRLTPGLYPSQCVLQRRGIWAGAASTDKRLGLLASATGRRQKNLGGDAGVAPGCPRPRADVSGASEVLGGRQKSPEGRQSRLLSLKHTALVRDVASRSRLRPTGGKLRYAERTAYLNQIGIVQRFQALDAQDREVVLTGYAPRKGMSAEALRFLWGAPYARKGQTERYEYWYYLGPLMNLAAHGNVYSKTGVHVEVYVVAGRVDSWIEFAPSNDSDDSGGCSGCD
jgi:hypothetical protein